MMRLRSIWHISREYAGIAEAGGVKDVVCGLAQAQARASLPVTVVLPFYGFLSAGTALESPVASFTLGMPDLDKGDGLYDEPVRVFSCERAGVRILFVDSPRFFNKRSVYTHTAEDEAENHWKKRGTGHWDFHQMNLLLQRAALEAAAVLDNIPSLIHCHDGHTAFLPAIMREDPRYRELFGGCGAILTIHNAGGGYHQEVWSRDFARKLTGLSDPVLDKGMLNGTVDPLLLAASYATLTTVSERYAIELLAEKGNEMSGGLGRTLREQGNALQGITNGIDPAPYDPRDRDATGLPCAYDPSRIDTSCKRECRQMLFQREGFAPRAQERPLYAFIGRLTGQKGVDVLHGAIRILSAQEPCPLFVVLGQGEREKEDLFRGLAAERACAGNLLFLPCYDPALAKLVYAASDFFLVPSEYEPCGLTDFIAQLFGSIPVVHCVGGLTKVIDGQNGFCWDAQSPAALAAAIRRTMVLFDENPRLLAEIRANAFQAIFSSHTWDRVLSESYLPLYRRTLEAGPWMPR